MVILRGDLVIIMDVLLTSSINYICGCVYTEYTVCGVNTVYTRIYSIYSYMQYILVYTKCSNSYDMIVMVCNNMRVMSWKRVKCRVKTRCQYQWNINKTGRVYFNARGEWVKCIHFQFSSQHNSSSSSRSIWLSSQQQLVTTAQEVARQLDSA